MAPEVVTPLVPAETLTEPAPEAVTPEVVPTPDVISNEAPIDTVPPFLGDAAVTEETVAEPVVEPGTEPLVP